MPPPKGHQAYNKNGEGGRPKIYTDEFIEKEAESLEEWMKKKENLFLEDFSFERGYRYDNLSIWAKKNERFSVTYDRFHKRQRAILFKGGLTKKFAHPMCALILGHSHGIVAKTEQKISGDAENPLPIWVTQATGTSKDLVNDTEKSTS